nr:uncharacterized protein LOC118970456 isoform X1 [Manis javanica]
MGASPQHCPLSLSPHPGHAIFKLTYLSNHDYKHLYFESDAATINEIVLKPSLGTFCVPGWCLGSCSDRPNLCPQLFLCQRRQTSNTEITKSVKTVTKVLCRSTTSWRREQALPGLTILLKNKEN